MKDEEMAEEYADNISGLELTCSLLSAKDKSHTYRLGRYDGFLAGLKAKKKQIEKAKYTLKKIIETVHNDRIDEYGARLVLIKDFAYECLEEIE